MFSGILVWSHSFDLSENLKVEPNLDDTNSEE
jgi:hypothetical protein